MTRIRNWLMVAMAIISIMGVVTFSLFILEESLQTVMFGTWAAQDAKNWGLVLKGCDTNRKINFVLKVMTYSVGWIQPFAFIAYKDYAKSMDYYIEALEAKVLAHKPELFDGRKISIMFKPTRRGAGIDTKYVYQMNRFYYYSDEELLGEEIQLSGILKIHDGIMLIAESE